MKQYLVVFAALNLFYFSQAQQVVLNGQVSMHNSKYNSGNIEFVQNTYLTADFAKPGSSDVEGRFQLEFVGLDPGTSVAVTAEKAGLEIVNRRDLMDVIIGRKTLLKIYLAQRGELAQSQAELMSINMKSLTAKNDDLIARLRKDNEDSKKAIAELEEQFGRKIADRFEAEALLQQKYSELKKQLPSYAMDLARQNLDYASETYIKAYEFFKKGEVERTLAILDTVALEASYKMAQETKSQGLDMQNKVAEMFEKAELQIGQIIESYLLRAKSYLLQFDYNNASNIYEKIASMYEENNFSPIKLAHIYDNLALFNQFAGNFTKAMNYQKQAITIKEKVLDLKDSDLAVSYNFMGRIYSRLERFDEAFNFYQKAIDINEDQLEEDDPQLGTSYNNISVYFRKMGEYDQALKYVDKALKIWEKSAPSELFYGYNEKALILKDMGKHEDALVYNMKWIRYMEETYGTQHFLLGHVYNNLADNLRNLGRFEEALPYHEKSLAISVEVLDPDHPDLGILYNNMADAYIGVQNYNLATNYIEKAIPIFESKLGTEHSNTIAAYGKLVMIYDGLAKYEKAITNQKKVIAGFEKIYGPDHLQVADAIFALGVVYQHAQDFDKAIPFHEKAIDIIKKKDRMHVNLSNSYIHMSRIFSAQKDFTKAIDYMNEAIEVDEANLKGDKRFLVEDYLQMADLYRMISKPKKTKEFRDKADHALATIPKERRGQLEEQLKELDLYLKTNKN